MRGRARTRAPASKCDASQPGTLQSREGTRQCAKQMIYQTLLIMQGNGRAAVGAAVGRAAATALSPSYSCRALGALLWALLTGAPSPAAAWLAGAAGAGASADELQAGLDACLQRALAALPPASQPSPAALVRFLRCLPSRWLAGQLQGQHRQAGLDACLQHAPAAPRGCPLQPRCGSAPSRTLNAHEALRQRPAPCTGHPAH